MPERYRIDELPCTVVGVEYIITDMQTGQPIGGRWTERKYAEHFARYLNDPETVVDLSPGA